MKANNKREAVFNKCGGKCAYCGCELSGKWQVDHAISKLYWFVKSVTDIDRVNHISNLMPSCPECNHYKRAKCIESVGTSIGFRDYLKTFHLRLAKLPKKTLVKKSEKRKLYMQTIADKYGITVDKPFNGIFYFETLKTKPQ